MDSSGSGQYGMATDHTEGAPPAQSSGFGAPPAQSSTFFNDSGAALAQLMEGMKTLMSGQQAQAAQIAALQNTQQPVTPATTTTDTTTEQSTQTTTKKARLPDVAKFTGQRDQWKAWKLDMSAKLTTDRAYFGDERTMLYYVYARLDGGAKANATTYVEAYGTQTSPNELVAYLDRIYGDPNHAERAVERLQTYKQRADQTFAKFLPTFEKNLADAGGQAWADPAKKGFLMGAIRADIKKELIAVEMPASYHDTCHGAG